MTNPRTRGQAQQASEIGKGVVEDENGNLINEDGYPMARPGEYEMQITDVEVRDVPPGKFNPKPSTALRVQVTLIGTKKGVGEYADDAITASLFVNAPKSDKLFYKDKDSGQIKSTNAGIFFQTMGLDVPQNQKFSKIEAEALIGGFLRGYVGHNSNGFHDIRIKNVVELPNGEFANRGLKPVVNEEHLEANRNLAADLFG